ncbi:MAG: DUF2235 domain-containing protein, partial [Acidobacteriota bacterium]
MADIPHAVPRPKRLVVVMDGTWNSPAAASERDDGDQVFKPSNPLKTSRAVRVHDDVAASLVAFGRPRPGDTVTAGGKVYTFVEALAGDDTDGQVDGKVAIGEGARHSLESLSFAINLRRHRGRYSAGMTRHPEVSAREVPGNRRRLHIVPRSGAGEAAWTQDTTVPGWRWVEPSGIDRTLRERGFDPGRGVAQVVYYDVGVGAMRSTPGVSNKVHRFIDKTFGGARGAGFEANIEDAYLFLSLNYRSGDELFLFGFSRGAASVRGLARFIDWMGGLVPSEDSYWIPRYFDAFLAGSSYGDTRAAVVEESFRRRLKKGQAEDKARAKAESIAGTVAPATIRFLGVWDSVLSIGRRRGAPHFGPTPPARVEHARQALAIDERRPDFEPRIWRGRSPENPAQTLEQRWFAGSHSNIGGGYVHDGLANVALRWMLDGARDVGLAVDEDYLRHFRPYAEDKYYDSSSLAWRTIQTVTFRRRVGVRPIEVDAAAGLTLHPSVLRRLAAGKVSESGREHERLEPYRPA